MSMMNKVEYKNQNIKGNFELRSEKGKDVLYIKSLQGKLQGTVMKMFGNKVRKDGVLTGRCVYDKTNLKLGKIIHYGKWSISQKARDILGIVKVEKKVKAEVEVEEKVDLDLNLDLLPFNEEMVKVGKKVKVKKLVK